MISERRQGIIDSYDWTLNYKRTTNGTSGETSWGMWMPQFYPELCSEVEERGAAYPVLLDVGCGNGAKLARYYKDGIAERILAMDISLVGLEQTRERIQKIESITRCKVIGGDATAIPLRDNSVDAITMSCIASHLVDEDITRAVSEQYRVLKPGGRLYVTEFGPSEYWHGQKVPEDGRFTFEWDSSNPRMSPEYSKYNGMYNRLFKIEDLVKSYTREGFKLEIGILLQHPNVATDSDQYEGRTLCNAILRKPVTKSYVFPNRAIIPGEFGKPLPAYMLVKYSEGENGGVIINLDVPPVREK